MNQGKIVKIISNQYTVLIGKERFIATALGKLRKGEKPMVGDEVLIDEINGKLCIEKVLERRNVLIRPAVSNIDQVLVVSSCKEPDFSSVLVDRLIFLITYYGIEPIIVITKMDLASKDDIVYQYIQDYKDSGYKVVLTGKEIELDDIKDALKGKISVLAGQSGAGKSTLLNRIDASFALRTQEISKALNRGKHTTRHCELFDVCDGLLADTPGFSSLDFSHIDSKVLKETIPDFKGISGCKFNDCCHINEPNCKVKEAVQLNKISKIRYKNYVDVVSLCDKVRSW